MTSPAATRPAAESALRIFLSHSTKDADFATTLAAALIGAGFQPWLCEVDIEIGANFVSKINQGLRESDIALLLWSQHAVNSRWTEEEWTAALSRQVEESSIRLGIILLPGCPMPLPPLLRTKNFVDARSDQPAALRQTVEWLQRRQAVQRLAGLRAPVYLPYYRPQDFVGRGAYLDRLRNTFTAEPSAFLLHGEPGAGKSTLALRFAWEAQKDFDAVIFQLCGQRPLDAITAELVERLPIDVKTRPPNEQRTQAKAWLRERQSLLVLDDVWSADVKQLEPGPPCWVLYTSRRQALSWIPTAETTKLEKFTEAEAEEFFHTYLDAVFGNSEVTRHREALLAFARQVECLPIAVAVGANLLREKSASALPRAVLKLRLNALTDGVKDVNALFGKAIESRSQAEQKLLTACAVCVPEGFWLPLAAEIAELSGDEAEDAADPLVHSSLLRVVDRDRRRFNLHALLRDQLRARLDPDDLATLRKRHTASLERLFKDWQTRWQDCRECLEEIIPAAGFLWQTGEGARESWLTYWGYALGLRVGELDAALRILQQHESFWTGRDDREAKNALQASYGNQALILKAWGRLDEAMALYKQQEAICLELGNKDGLQNSYGNQALILQDWGRLEEALALLKKQEVICLELGNKDSLQRSYGNQALILKEWGRLDEARALYKQQEVICLELGNKDSLQITYGNQALILKAWGRLEEAMALHKKEEAICLELGNKDSLQRSYGNQAGIFHLWGRLEEAMALYKQQEAICLELGNKYGLQKTYGNQALILINQDRLNEALVLLQKSETICIELGLKKDLGYCYWQRASLAHTQGDRQTAKEKLKQALAIFTELKMPRERDAVQANLDILSGEAPD